MPFTYANNGNTLTAGGASYTYTPSNLLETVTNTNGTASYAYDGDDQRARATLEGSTTYYVRGPGGQLLTEWKNPGVTTTTIRDYVYAGSRLLAAVERSSTRWTPSSTDPNDHCGVIVPGGPAIMVTVASGQVPCFKFNGAPGQMVSTRMLAVSPSAFNDTWSLCVRKSGENIGCHFALNGQTSNFVDTVALVAGGEYEVTLDPWGAGGGMVSVQLWNVVHVTGTIPTDGTPVSVVLDTPGQNAMLSFSGTSGQNVSALLSALTPTPFESAWNLCIQRADGFNVGCHFVPGGYPTSFTDALVLPSTGSYYVLIDPWDLGGGSASVSLWNVVHVTQPIDGDGTPVTVAVNTPGQRGILTFNGTVGQSVSALMTSVSPSSFATTWYLCIQKPDGNTLACRFASFGSTIFQDALVLENDGLHAVIADPVDTSGGTVSVRLWSLSNVTGSIAVNGDAVPVSIGTPGQNARLTFTVGAQQSVTVRLTNNQLGSPTIRLLRSDNSQVTALTWSTTNFNLSTVTLEPGTYVVEVDPSDTSTGTITVAVTSP